jgi:hypothetical protein
VYSSGYADVTGYTTSTDFPISTDAYQGSHGGGSHDAFVTRLSPSGKLFFSTYLGGSGYDRGHGISVDSSGYAYVTGYTSSTDFPISTDAYQGSHGDGGMYHDAFVTRLSPSGSTLSYSTYLGGSGYDRGHGISVDSSGSAYVTGETRSTDFPTQNASQGSHGDGGGYFDAFVTKIITASAPPSGIGNINPGMLLLLLLDD